MEKENNNIFREQYSKDTIQIKVAKLIINKLVI